MDYEELQKAIERARAKLADSNPPNWVEALVRPIGEALANRTGWKLELLGPCGLGAQVHINLFRPGVDLDDLDVKYMSGNCRSLLVCPGNLRVGELKLVDASKEVGDYPPGSVGALNGLNFATEVVPQDADVEWFVARLSA